ncbi:MAG: hypothetical protein JXC36_02500 [Candidatus Atribacteria bacterium]|nr:hypothetical protein [Candidatus Atribacteria bacterium]
MNKSEIELVCNDIIESQNYKRYGYNAVSFLFYLPNTDTNGQYSAAMAEWAPFGEWSKAGQMLPRDYSNHEFKITIADEVKHIDKTGISLDQRMRIFYNIAAIQDSLIALNPNDPSVGKKSLAIAEKKYGLSSKDISLIYLERLKKNWPIPAL